MQTSKFT